MIFLIFSVDVYDELLFIAIKSEGKSIAKEEVPNSEDRKNCLRNI